MFDWGKKWKKRLGRLTLSGSFFFMWSLPLLFPITPPYTIIIVNCDHPCDALSHTKTHSHSRSHLPNCCPPQKSPLLKRSLHKTLYALSVHKKKKLQGNFWCLHWQNKKKKEYYKTHQSQVKNEIKRRKTEIKSVQQRLVLYWIIMVYIYCSTILLHKK